MRRDTHDSVLLTGATGLLGQYLLRDLISRGVHVAVLARPKGRKSVKQRVAELLGNEELPSDLTCLEGDITQPGLGLSADARRWVSRHCGRILHNAASLTFHGRDRAREPWLSNLTGTINTATLAQEIGVREFHHVSTAYVCGNRGGIVRENELNVGQGFRNDYEEVKCTAETWLRDEARFPSLTVYRPAVIVGDSETGFTSTYHGLYRFFQFTWLLAQQAERDADGRWLHPVRLRLTGQEYRNLVPVDWVSAVIARIFSDADAHGKTYHLTPTEPTRSYQIEDALAEYFNYHGVTFAGPNGVPSESMNEREKLFYEYISAHESYLSTEPKFDASNTLHAVPDLPCPAIDEACLRRLIEFGVWDRWGKGQPARRVAAE